MTDPSDHRPKSETTFELERYKAREAHILELLKATIAFEHAGLRPPYILNGGALLAVLTFLGGTLKGEKITPAQFDLHLLRFAFVAWSLGLLAAFGATTCAYFSQLAFRKEASRRRDASEAQKSGDDHDACEKTAEAVTFGRSGELWRNGAYVCGALSIICFVVGMMLSVLSF